MTEALAAILLFVLCIGWFVLPLIPTIREIRRGGEARPLAVDRENDGEVRHFARRFKAYLESNFVTPTLRECLDSGSDFKGQLQDGTPYFIADRDGAESIQTNAIVMFSKPVVLSDGFEFTQGIYSTAHIDCGPHSLIRSLYGEDGARLRERTVVLRWLYVGKDLVAGKGCALYGRASAEESMHIGEDVEFERLHAKRILFGDASAGVASPEDVPANDGQANSRPLRPFTCADARARRLSANSYAIDEDLYIPPGTLARGNFVVRGAVRIGGGARVEGSIKSYQDMHIEAAAVVDGSVTSGKDLEIGRGCRVRGPAVAGRRLKVGSGCRIGFEESPTSAIAPSIFIDSGVLVYGSVWARKYGKAGG